MKKFLPILLLLGSTVFLFPKVTYAATTHDMATSTNWNIRIDGPEASGFLGQYSTIVADIDDDGKNDLIVGARGANNNSRSASGSVFVIYASLLESLGGVGNTIDLSDSTKYNLRFDGAAASDRLGIGAAVGNLDNDDKLDIVIGATGADFNSRSGSGSAYVISSSLIDDYSGTGNNIDLATTSNFNLRFDGAAASDALPSIRSLYISDLDGDGKMDLTMGASSDNNSRADSGSLFVVYNTIIDDYSGTGNTIDLNDTSNFNLRFDGPEASYLLTENATTFVGDANGDGRSDILVGAFFAGYNSRSSSGSLYLILSSVFSSITGTGNTFDLATSANYNLRFDGATAGDAFSLSPNVGDFDNDGKPDIVAGANIADFNSRSSSGSVYAIYGTIVDDYSGTGNNIDLATTTNYNLRFDGAAESTFLGEAGQDVGDFDGDGKVDLVIRSYNDGNNSRSGSGSVYYIYNSLINSYSSTGNNIDLSSSSTYTLRFDGAAASDALGSYRVPAKVFSNNDLNNDGRFDTVEGAFLADYNSRANSGSLYIVYNFPHTITAYALPSVLFGGVATVIGTVSSPNSVTAISNVQYSLDNSAPSASSWSSCTAVDGSFDSIVENFRCSITGINDGPHRVYIRSSDANSSYTLESSLVFLTFDMGFRTQMAFSPGANSRPGWVLPIMAGPSFVGIPDFIRGQSLSHNAMTYIPRGSSVHDVAIFIKEIAPETLSQLTKKVPPPSNQGFKPVGLIFDFKSLSSFNGAPIPEFNKPVTIIIPYNPAILGKSTSKNLKILAYDPKTMRWKVLPYTIVNPITQTVATTTKTFTYFTVVR